MTRIRNLALLATTLAFTVLLTAGPAFATEGERTKVELPKTPHDRVGLILLGVSVLVVIGMLDNMRRQLKGERRQADGKWRWR